MDKKLRFSAVVLFLCLGAAATLAAGPDGPPRIPGWTPESELEDGALPLDVRIATEGIEAVGPPPCPVGPEFEEWASRRPSRGAPRRAVMGPMAPVPPSSVIIQDGVMLIEDDGSFTNHDNPFDLDALSIQYTPTADGYSVQMVPFVFDFSFGGSLFTNRRSWHVEPVNLTNFTFPFAGAGQSQIWVTSALGLHFVDPQAPTTYQLTPTQVLMDRTPRIAPLQQGTSLYGWDAYMREEADHVVFTWQADGGNRVNVQTILYDDGRILVSYHTVGDPEPFHGAAVVIDGNASFWSDTQTLVSVLDPSGDVTVPPPDGPAIDITNFAVQQMGGTDLLRIDIELVSPPPGTTDGVLLYWVPMWDESGDPDMVHEVSLYWEDGAWISTSDPVEIVGNTLQVFVMMSDLALTDDDVFFRVDTYQDVGGGPARHDMIPLTEAAASPPTSVMLDISAQAPVTVEGPPVFEAFTLPELLLQAVKAYVDAEMNSPRFDGLAVYQTFYTDVIFYAGGFNTGGEPSVDGIGPWNSSSNPEAPSLLHMSRIRAGWNATDPGRWHLIGHEFGHHWLYKFRIDQGSGPQRVLNPVSAHPAAWVDTRAATPVYDATDSANIGGGTWQDNGDGSWTTPDRDTHYGYSWHDLYLMGLAADTEVVDWFYIDNANPPQADEYYPPRNETVTGDRVGVDVGQIIAAEGARFPSYGASRTAFDVFMILVARPGQWDDTDTQWVAETCNIASTNFETSTLARGTLRCSFQPPDGWIIDPASGPTITRGQTINFTGDGADADGDGLGSLEWDFDGQGPPAIGPGPHMVQFDNLGDFTVTLTARDGMGMPDPTPASIVVHVGNLPPEGTINLPATDPTIYEGDEVGFLGDALDPDGDFISINWTFDGVAPDASGSGLHRITYPTQGTYQVVMEVEDQHGLADPDPDTRTVTVLQNLPPDADIDDPATDIQVGEGTLVSFLGSVTDPEGHAVTLTWSFDGAAPDASGAGPHDVLFDTAGTYVVQLTAEDEFGAVDPAPPTVTVEVVPNDPPDAVIDLPATDLEVTTTDPVTFQGSYTDPDGHTVDLLWTFDGASPDLAGPGPHDVTFVTPGVYQVRLEATDELGLDDPSPAEVTITVCEVPGEVENVRVLASFGQAMAILWDDLVPATDDYLLYTANAPDGPWTQQGQADSGTTGIGMSIPPGLWFFQVAGRNQPICIGPWR